LGNASLLSKVIIGGAEEEIALEKLAKTMQEEEKQIRNEFKDISKEEVYKKVTENLDKKGIKCAALRYDDYGDGAATENSKYIENCEKLDDVRGHLKNNFSPSFDTYSAISTPASTTPASTTSSPGIFSKISSIFSFGSPKPPPEAAVNPMYAASYESKPAYHDYSGQTAETVYDKNVSYDQVDRVLSRKAKADY